ncbi:MAG: hypothetical protein FJ363_12325 [Gemmatimonadetes bacterium]|nr:hypothetical protein [Gemmatimonadota bacterium]
MNQQPGKWKDVGRAVAAAVGATVLIALIISIGRWWKDAPNATDSVQISRSALFVEYLQIAGIMIGIVVAIIFLSLALERVPSPRARLGKLLRPILSAAVLCGIAYYAVERELIRSCSQWECTDGFGNTLSSAPALLRSLDPPGASDWAGWRQALTDWCVYLGGVFALLRIHRRTKDSRPRAE